MKFIFLLAPFGARDPVHTPKSFSNLSESKHILSHRDLLVLMLQILKEQLPSVYTSLMHTMQLWSIVGLKRWLTVERGVQFPACTWGSSWGSSAAFWPQWTHPHWQTQTYSHWHTQTNTHRGIPTLTHTHTGRNKFWKINIVYFYCKI